VIAAHLDLDAFFHATVDGLGTAVVGQFDGHSARSPSVARATMARMASKRPRDLNKLAARLA
jgi:hypothetical protein